MYSHKIHSSHRLSILHFSGRTTATEITRCLSQLYADPEFSTEFDGLADFRGVTQSVEPEELRSVVALVASQGVIGRWALLVDKPTETALAMIYRELITPVHPLSVFSTLRGASNYLGLDLLQFLDDDALY
jgi:hypothetical protein